MIVVGLVFGVFVVSMVGWYIAQKRRQREGQRSVTSAWVRNHKYPKDGDRRGTE